MEFRSGRGARDGRRRLSDGWRRVLSIVLVLLVAFSLATARLIVWPAQGMPARVSAVVVLAGRGDRLAVALRLAREHRASTLVVSQGWHGYGGACPPAMEGVKIICFDPNPGNTRGEAETVGQLAMRYHWDSVVLVVSAGQDTRARIIVRRCFDGSIYVVLAPLSLGQWPYEIVYGWGALIKAVALFRACLSCLRHLMCSGVSRPPARRSYTGGPLPKRQVPTPGCDGGSQRPVLAVKSGYQGNAVEPTTIAGIRVSPIGLGTGRLASLGAGHSLSEAARLLDAAFDLGITFVDTADTYGSTTCERWLGKAMHRRPHRFVVATKCGLPTAHLRGPLTPLNQPAKKILQRIGQQHYLEPGYVRRSIDGSLRRLRRERIEFYFLHEPPLGVDRMDALFEVLEEGAVAITSSTR